MSVSKDGEIQSKGARYYWKDPERSKMQSAVTYYRTRRAKGHNDPPSPDSKLAKYCTKHGLDVMAVIDGTQTLPNIRQELQDPKLIKLQSLADCFRQTYEAYQRKPWIPEETHLLRIWCDEHGVDVMDVITGKITIIQIAKG